MPKGADERGRRNRKRTIRTSTGSEMIVDGDLLTIMDLLYQEVTARHDLDRSFADMTREIANLVAQMTAAELRAYLQEALFVNTITYENQKAAAYIRKVGGRLSTVPAASSAARARAAKMGVPASGRKRNGG